MLKKLLKYDLKANLKVYLLMYGVLIGSAIGTRLTFIDWMSEVDQTSFVGELGGLFLLFSYVITLIAVNIACIVLIVRRFYKHLFGSEGYLTFTLPVTAEQHFFSKVISAVILYVSTVLMQIVSFVILQWGLLDEAFAEITAGDIWELLSNSLMPEWEIIAQGLILVMSLLASLLMVYFAICVGQMVNRHRVISAVAIYFGLNALSEAVVTLLRDIFLEVSYIGMSYGVEYYVFTGVCLVIELVGFSFGSILIMKKKLNLE